MAVSFRALRGDTLQVPSWEHEVRSSTAYRASCLAIGVPAVLLWANAREFKATCPLLPWRAIAAGLALQALCSYQGDVATWGRSSAWKVADVWLAVPNTILYALLGILPLVGAADWPPVVSVVQLSCFVWAVACKSRSLAALRSRNRSEFMAQHAAWHWVISGGACISIASVLAQEGSS